MSRVLIYFWTNTFNSQLKQKHKNARYMFYPKNLAPWWDSNSDPQADVIPQRHGEVMISTFGYTVSAKSCVFIEN
jgi:hypothetical protein